VFIYFQPLSSIPRGHICQIDPDQKDPAYSQTLESLSLDPIYCLHFTSKASLYGFSHWKCIGQSINFTPCSEIFLHHSAMKCQSRSSGIISQSKGADSPPLSWNCQSGYQVVPVVWCALWCAHWSETTSSVEDYWQSSLQKQLGTTKHRILSGEVVCCEAKEGEGTEQHIQAPIFCSMLSFSWLL